MTEKKKEEKVKWTPLFYASGLIFFAWLAWGVGVSYVYEMSLAGQFGDLFGGVNALFSGLAFATLIFTAYLQRRELELQREELTETRKVLMGQQQQMELQNKTLTKQAFETTFFEWLSLHHEIVSNVSYGDKRGRVAFVKFKEYLTGSYLAKIRTNLNKGFDADPKELVAAASREFSLNLGFDQLAVRDTYDQFYKDHGNQIGHYFRNLYNFLKFVSNSSLSDREKRFYTNIMRAHLSTSELMVLFYNGLSGVGGNSVKYYEEFALFNNLAPDQLLIPEHNWYYGAQVFHPSPDKFPDEITASLNGDKRKVLLASAG